MSDHTRKLGLASILALILLSGTSIAAGRLAVERPAGLASDPVSGLWYEVGAGSASGGGISDNGGDSQLPSLAVAPDGTLYAAWEDHSVAPAQVYLLRWDGASWSEVGTNSAQFGGISDTDADSLGPDVAVAPDGTPYVAWSDRPADGDSEIYVRRWNGSAWEEVGPGSASGGGISDNSGGSYSPSMGFATDGTPYVAWYDYSTVPSQIYVRRWKAGSWQEVGPGSASGRGISNTSSWARNPSLAIASDGAVYVAWSDESTGVTEIYLRRWTGTAWDEVGAGSAGGDGVSNTGDWSTAPSVALAPDDTPYVAWQDYSSAPVGPDIYVRRWNGVAWVEVGAGSASGGGISGGVGWSHEPSLAVAPDGTPYVGWRDSADGDYEIYVRRWSGSDWDEVGAGSASGGGISDNGGLSIGTCLLFARGGTPTVAWQDESAGDLEIYVRQGANLIPLGLEVTQAIQSISNTVTLVEGKRTYARFHVGSGGPVLDRVGARLTASRAGQPLGDAMQPLNPGMVITASASPDRGQIDDSFLFELDPGWVSGTLQLRAELNPARTVAETEYADNVFTATVTFEPSPPLTVTLVGVIYAENNITYTAAVTDYDRIASWLRTAYPTGRLNLITRTLTITGGLPTASELNQRLATLYTLDAKNIDRCPGTRYHGLVDDGDLAHFMRGRAVDIPACIASGPTGEDGWPWDDDGSYGDWYAGHELGHSLGRYHVEFCGAWGGRPYPYPDGKIGGPVSDPDRFYGFNVETRYIYTPTGWTDVMTYCDYEWISDFTYQGIYERLVTETVRVAAVGPSAPAPGSECLLVLGEMNLTQGTAELGTLYRLPDLTPSTRPAVSTYTLRLLDAGDNALVEYPFTPGKDTEYEPGEDLMASIYEIVPYAAGTARVAVVGGGIEITTRTVSVNPPQVTVTHPNGGEQLGQKAVVTWLGTDLDGDSLTYALLYSADDGATWTAVASGIAGTGYTLRTGELPGSDVARIRVLASDGVNTARDDSDGSFRVPFKVPVARIHSPRTGESMLDEQTVVLAGEAYDREDGPLSDPRLLWLSSLDGTLGTGRAIAVTGLSAGEHRVTLQATDGDGMTGTAHITLQIRTRYPVYLPLVLRKSP